MKISLLFASLLSVAMAHAEPPSLKGLAPGMTKAQLAEVLPGITDACMPTSKEAGNEGCLYYPKRSRARNPAFDTLAGGDVETWFAIVREGIATSIMVTMQTGNFDRVAAALSEKWGKPSASESSTVQNRMGATFDQTTITWRVDGSVVTAKRRSSKIDQMSVSLTTEKEIAESGRERREVRPKADAKDL